MGPPSNIKLITTFFQSSIFALILAIVVHYVSELFPGSRLQPDCSLKPQEFATFTDFYPFYLCEHTLPRTKLFHFVATFNVSVFLLMLINSKAISTKVRIFVFALVQAYGLAWISHFFVEHNKPATFKFPIYSFIGDWMMFKDALLGSVSLF